MEEHMTQHTPRGRAPGRWWRLLGVLGGLYLVVFGGFVVALGGADDSPGLGGMGLVTAIIGVVMLVRVLRRGAAD